MLTFWWWISPDCAIDGSFTRPQSPAAPLHLALAQGTEEVGGTDLGEIKRRPEGLRISMAGINSIYIYMGLSENVVYPYTQWFC